VSAKLGIAVDVQRPRVGVEHRLIGAPAPASEALSAPPPECDATRSRAKFLAANTLFTYTR